MFVVDCFVLDMNRTAHNVLHLLLIFFSTRGSVQSQGLTYSIPGSTIELQPQVNAVVVRLIECSCRLFTLLAAEHPTVGGGYGQSVPRPVSRHELCVSFCSCNICLKQSA